jgi:hypothetical protein
MMSSPSLLRVHENLSQTFVDPSLQRGLKLSDAEWIAVERLDRVPQGSLMEALATRSLADQPTGRLVDRIESVREDFGAAPPPASYSEAVQANGIALYGWPEPLPPAHAVETSWAYGAQPDLFDFMERPAREPTDLSTAEVTETVQQGFAGAAHQIWPAHNGSPMPGPGFAPDRLPPDAALIDAVQPLVSAYEATARLAADATAASDALENLKQLLTMRLGESQAGAPPQPSEPPSGATIIPLASAAGTPPPLPVTSHHAAASAPVRPQDLQPPAELVPFPVAHVSASTMMPAVASLVPTARAVPEAATGPDAFPVMPLPPQPPPAMPVERKQHVKTANKLPVRVRPAPRPHRQQLDVRGFFAGFALSWAVGVVLYFYMTAG